MVCFIRISAVEKHRAGKVRMCVTTSVTARKAFLISLYIDKDMEEVRERPQERLWNSIMDRGLGSEEAPRP